MKLINTFDYHRGSPDVSVDSYIRSKRVELGESLESKTKIYLDTKYWIYFRDVLLGRIDSGPIFDSYNVLVSLCETGAVICPICEDVFYEITKQVDIETLTTSIKLIDQLSSGVVLTTQEERIKAEILYFFYRYRERTTNLYQPKYLVWTKIGQVLGGYMPCNTTFDEKDELMIQKAFFDQVWHNSLHDACELFGFSKLYDMPRMPDLSASLNEHSKQTKEKLNSFKDLFLDEIYWSVQYISNLLSEAMEYIYTSETGKVITEAERKASEERNLLSNMVCNIFRYGKEGDNFPTLKVGAGVHAAIRLDAKRSFVENDYYDFRHAQAAVPYCDFFFTEKNLRHILKLNSLAYDKEYCCEVVSKPGEVLKTLKELEATGERAGRYAV